MPKLHLDYSDGHYSTRPLSEEEAAKLEEQGGEVAYIEERVLDAWHRHCDEECAWQALWRAISNEQSMRRREQELMPLEAAAREIARLKADLARAKRMETYYETKYVQYLGERHRNEYGEYTCVYPQPGCQIDALPPEWQEHAQEILEQRGASRAEEGVKYQDSAGSRDGGDRAAAQGYPCCCGHQHQLIDAAAAQKLRGAGFLVEHDTETTGGEE